MVDEKQKLWKYYYVSMSVLLLEEDSCMYGKFGAESLYSILVSNMMGLLCLCLLFGTYILCQMQSIFILS